MMIKVKYKHLITEYKGIEKFWCCNTMRWNFYLGRYYPHAECYMELEKVRRVE
jgi:hypothetical protein